MNIRSVKSTDIKDLAKVHVDTWKTTYKGIVSDEFLQKLSYDEREKLWSTFLKEENINRFIFVVENEFGIVIGFAIGGLERTNNPSYKGELWGIYILKEYQKKGIGKALVKKIIETLLNLNITSMLVWVLKDNPYRSFYENLGGIIVDQKPTEIGQERLIEIAYGWNDIRTLWKNLCSS